MIPDGIILQPGHKYFVLMGDEDNYELILNAEVIKMCIHEGVTHDIGTQWDDNGCKLRCSCNMNAQAECDYIKCPAHSSSSCVLSKEAPANFVPTPGNCCPPVF